MNKMNKLINKLINEHMNKINKLIIYIVSQIKYVFIIHSLEAKARTAFAR